MKDPLVTVEWLKQHLNEVVVLDATYYLPADPERIRSDFKTLRIPGAALFEIDDICDKNSDLPHMLPSDNYFSEAMARLGVDASAPIVAYDRSANHFSASRVWLTLKLFGLTDCYVLNGGLNAWIESGGKTETGETRLNPVDPRHWMLESARVVSGEQMSEYVRSGRETILDARSRERFDGLVPEPRPGLPSGHVPGAVSVPFTTLTYADGFFMPPEVFQERFATVGDGEPIVSCGSGITACVLALGLERIGKQSRLYDGSWIEWGRGHLVPIDRSSS